VTPARFASCNRLLKGISVLEDRNKQELAQLSLKREKLQNELVNLAKSIGDKNYADARLLLPMSRRVGLSANTLKQCQLDIVKAYQRSTKLSRSKTLLLDRLHRHNIEQQEEELSDMISNFVSSHRSGQSSAS
jgi:hypothetical protein